MTSDGGRAPIVFVDSLRKTYRGGLLSRRGDLTALAGISLLARPGEVFGLLGPNGAGKTTLIKILLGVIRSSGGTATLFGMPAGSTAARRRVGYLPESLRVDRHHTARTALAFYGRLSGLDGRTIHQRSDELLKLVGLTGRDRESVRRFSKGMLQRLGLAQALMHDPDLLMLDEPTDGLDPVGRSEVRRVIERLRDAGKTIFLNSHILHEVEMVCTHLAIMARGRVLMTGSMAELRGGGPAAGHLIVDVEFDGPESDVEVSEDWNTRWRDWLMRCGGDDSPVAVQEIDATPSPVHSMVRVRGRLTCPDQASVDRLVDQVRGGGGSLIRLQPKTVSLEETFMRLVTEADSQ